MQLITRKFGINSPSMKLQVENRKFKKALEKIAAPSIMGRKEMKIIAKKALEK